jgi:hypothetical protein
MKIYISAGFTERERLRPMRDELWKMGHQVVSTWLDESSRPSGMAQEIFYKKLGIKDVAEIIGADLLISDHMAPSTSGGRDIEYGVALGLHQHIQIWIVGEPVRLSPFHVLADRRFLKWQELLDELREVKA